MRSFYASVKAHNENPAAFTGRPKLPRYGKKGGRHTVEITNQDAVIYTNGDGSKHLKLPKTKEVLKLGAMPIRGRLKQVNIIPTHGVFLITLTFEDVTQPKTPVSVPKRIASIDLGVNNFAAITNNIGEPCLLFKGGVIKSVNQYYNKRMAEIESAQTKGGTEKFVPMLKSDELCVWRECRVSDFMHKVAKYVINWAVTNGIDTFVIGENMGWKQNLNMGHVGNRNFAYIPFQKFKDIMSYLCAQNGINIVFAEELYSSKASFLDNDPIPTYGDKSTEAKCPAGVFSGKRAPTRYSTGFEPMYRKAGFRGLYTASDGTVINSDLNGSANIGRKCFPGMYETGEMPDFGSVVVIKHPDYEAAAKNRKKQLASSKGVSKSRQKRLNRKANVTQK